jgi:hypothetical protein
MKKKFSIGIIVILIIFALTEVFKKKNFDSIIKEGVTVNATVTDFSYTKNLWILEYTFFVDDVKYTGRCRTRLFKCSNGKKGCLGEIFKAKYLPENPNKSIIDLETYNSYKIH